MESRLLFIMNKTAYPTESELLSELSKIFEELDFEPEVLHADDNTYEKELEKYFQRMKKEIDCKAIITCNAAEIERIMEMSDCLYVTYLREGGDNFYKHEEKLKYGRQNTVVFCPNQKRVQCIKEKYENIGEVLYANLESEAGERIEAEAAMAMDVQELIAVKCGQASVLKLFVQRALNSGDLPQAKTLIEQYKEKCPEDLDVIAMETMLDLYRGDTDAALCHALEGVRKYPCSGDLQYNLGSIYEVKEEWFLAWVSYGRAITIYIQANKHRKKEKLKLKEKFEFCRKMYELNPDSREHAGCDTMLTNSFGMKVNAFRDAVQILGNYFWESADEKIYAGIFKEDFLTRSYKDNLDLLHTKGEFVKVTEGNEFEIGHEQTDVLVPIAAKNDKTMHIVMHEENEYKIEQSVNRHFNYYRIPSDSKIYSSGTSYYGRPIPLRYEQDKKKLVLNLFVDGLAQCTLDGDNFKRLMPHTARFFEKGTICTRAYSASEWTYPSIASYVTGLHTTRHMMFHNILDGTLPKEYPVLAEYFHEKGYFTAEMTGNWRAIPTYGYCRGYDQYIYQHMHTGFRIEDLIGEMIDHIEAFKETNQFLGVCINELHDIADGLELPHSVQGRLDMETCVYEELGPTSVKQEFSKNMGRKYEAMASRIDILLNMLFQYIESNYNDEDILVSLYADHGQGYFVPEGKHFCSDGRARVAFMFRGGGVQQQVCDEVISACDYIKIMCSLADINMKDIKIDGVLPKAFGGEGRDYALIESIHPGDEYNAAIYAKDRVFYFNNSFPVQDDGRFYLRDCWVRLTDIQDNDIDDDEMYQKYLSVILEHIAPLCIYD